MRTILVIRSSAMGDVAMTSRVISSLLATYPQVRVVMLTRGFFAPFFEPNERFSIHNIELHGQHKGLQGIRKLYTELRQQYDIELVADLHSKIYSKVLTLFFRLARIPVFEIDKGRSEKRALTRREKKVLKPLKTTLQRYADVLAQASLPIEVDQQLHRVDRPIPEKFSPKTTHWIGIAPFAQHKGKRLGINIIKEVIAALGEHYPMTRVLIFGGGESEESIALSLERDHENCTSAIGKVKLSEELDLIANLDLMVTMDSSSMHMASLVGVPAVSVWGATHPYAGFLGVGQSAENAVQINDLNCRPCSVYGNKPCYRDDYACMNMITSEMIIKKIDAILLANSH